MRFIRRKRLFESYGENTTKWLSELVLIQYLSVDSGRVDRMQQSSDKNCIKCNNELMKCETGDGIKGILVKNPTGNGLFTNKKHTIVHPYVCFQCGYTEWYAEKPSQLQ